MKPEIHLPRVNSGKISLGKTMFPRAKVRSVTTAINTLDAVFGALNNRNISVLLSRPIYSGEYAVNQK